MTPDERLIQQKLSDVDFTLKYREARAYTADGWVEYIGFAKPDTLKSQSKWCIKKLIYDGVNSTDSLFANGKNEFIHCWNDRASYSYNNN